MKSEKSISKKEKKERIFIELYQYGITQNTIRRYW